MNRAIKYIKIIILIGIAILIVTGVAKGVEQSRIYNKENITYSDLKATPFHLYESMEASSDLREINMKFLLFSGTEHMGSVEVSENDSIDITCSTGKLKVLILDEEGNQKFYDKVTELHYEPVAAGEYDIYAIGKWYTGKVSVEY